MATGVGYPQEGQILEWEDYARAETSTGSRGVGGGEVGVSKVLI